MHWIRFALAGYALAGIHSPSVRADEPVSLERTMVRAAPEVLKYCRERGYRNVGVLKFQVSKDGANPTDNAGTLNRTVARQLEMALILANSARDPIGIIEDASAVAATTAGANHLTPEGRLKLFEPKYALAWGKDRVSADAFITGFVGVEKDLKALNIQLMVFDRTENKFQRLGPTRTALNDPRKLTEIGESFSTRGFSDGGEIELAPAPQREKAVFEEASQAKENPARNPAVDAGAPVKLSVFYDGRPVPFEVKAGRAFLAEPATGQKVVMKLTRAAGKGTLACVLKVNGENTLFREKQPDLECRKWLLTPENAAGVVVNGYQRDQQTFEQFKVLSKAESKAREMDYGADVGTITLSIFRERTGPRPRGNLSDEAYMTKALESAKLPDTKPDSFGAMISQMEASANAPRGMIDAGETGKGGITYVQFEPDPTPVMGLTLFYYLR